MLIIGAKGFAKEVLEILIQNGDSKDVCFYDDISIDSPEKLYYKYNVLKSENEARDYFINVDNRFTIGIGNPELRYKMFEKFNKLGGKFTTIISKKTTIGSFAVEIGEGCIIMPGVIISNNVKIERGTMVYYNSIITHDVKIGEFCEISPSVNLLGGSTIGNKSHIATASVIFPRVSIGSNVVVAAGAIVNNDVPNNVLVAGIPAIIKKKTK